MDGWYYHVACHIQMPLQILSWRKKLNVKLVQRRLPLLLVRQHLWWTITQWKDVLWSHESVFNIHFKEMDTMWSWPKTVDLPDYYQQQVQKPGSVMVRGCISALGKANYTSVSGLKWFKMYLHQQSTWSWWDKPHNTFSSYCLQLNTILSEFKTYCF